MLAQPLSSAKISSSRKQSPNTGTVTAPPITQVVAGKAKAYVELMKPELSALVVVSGAAGFLLTGCVNPITAVSTVGGLVCAAGSAAAWNQIVEIEHDSKMTRTHNRPLPTGRLSKNEAIGFCAGTGALGVTALTLGANPLSGVLGLANIVIYGALYTPMKRMTAHNTHMGAIVGALPIVIGWTGGGCSLVALEPMLMFTTMFAWQYPHFMGIAWKYRKDYSKAGYKMTSTEPKVTGGPRTASWALNGTLVMCAIPFASTSLGLTSCMFIVSSALPNAAMLWGCHKFKQNPSGRTSNTLIRIGFVHLLFFLGLLYFHSTNPALEQHLNSVRNILRQTGRSACVHESSKGELNLRSLCPVPEETTTEKIAKK